MSLRKQIGVLEMYTIGQLLCRLVFKKMFIFIHVKDSDEFIQSQSYSNFVPHSCISWIWWHTKSGLYKDDNLVENKGPFTNTCKGGWCKKGPLKCLTLVRGALKKITTDFPLKIEFTCFSLGLTSNFHGKKGGPDFFFFFFLRSEGGAPKHFRDKYFLHQGPPYKCL